MLQYCLITFNGISIPGGDSLMVPGNAQHIQTNEALLFIIEIRHVMEYTRVDTWTIKQASISDSNRSICSRQLGRTPPPQPVQ